MSEEQNIPQENSTQSPVDKEQIPNSEKEIVNENIPQQKFPEDKEPPVTKQPETSIQQQATQDMEKISVVFDASIFHEMH